MTNVKPRDGRRTSLPRIPRCPIDAPNAVYEALGQNDRSLYVGGTTRDVNKRLNEHERNAAPWIPLTRRLVRDCYRSEQTMWFIEQLKIASKCPEFNERDKPSSCPTDLGLRELLGEDYYR